MNDERDDLPARLSEHLERRRRQQEELERMSSETRRLAENQDPGHWWLRNPGGSEAASPVTRSRGVGPTSLTVILPIHNAYEALDDCLRSLSRHTTYPASILLIDDASTDPRIGDLLEAAANLEGVRVLRNVENLGFTATVNRALRSCAGDVVLLNSDTAVGPRWLEQLVDRAYAAPDIATVTPISDNAGAFSVPRPDEPNPLPPQLGVADAARLFSAEGSDAAPEAPTGGGFCLYIKRAVIDAIGGFDADAFPRGYGEENDFCMRARRAGWRHIIDGRTFVHHERGSSFGEAKAALLAAGRKKLDELHPDYTGLARAFVASEPMVEVRAQAERLLSRDDSLVAPRLLFVIHDGGGGAIATNWDLMRALSAEFECFVFRSDRWRLRFGRVADGEFQSLDERRLERAILLGDFSRSDYRDAFADALDRCRPELVHVRHVFKHTLDAPQLAADRSIPVVMSIHDYYTICPTIQLVDDNGRFCGGPCSPGHGVCPTLVKAGRLPPLKHAFVYQWREEMDAALRCVDAFVTTSAQAREIHRQMHPAMRAARFDVIDHGRNLKQSTGLAEPPEPGGAVRILIPGNFDRHKGADLLRRMLELDVENRLELHFLGDMPERHRDLGTVHGSYTRDTFPDRVGEIRPAFIGIFSVWAETYNHVLTEAWAAGVPALVTDIGAPAERVRGHGGGFLVPLEDPEAALRAVFAAADDPERYGLELARATLHDIPSVAEMTERYANLYREVLDRRRAVAAPTSAREEPLARGIWKMTAVIPGRYPSAFVRILRRYQHPEIEWKLRTRIRTWPSDLVLDDAQLVLVQRNAVPPDEIAPFVAELRRRGLPLVLDLDDHLLASEYEDAELFATDAEALRILLDAASLVTVSTPALAETIGELCRSVMVVPNQLDERLFLGGPALEAAAPQSTTDRPLRVVYAGSPSHTGDLAFLRRVMGCLAAERPGRFELDVVGGEHLTSDAGWYRRREVPAGQSYYPNYVALLREWRPEWDIAVAPLLDTPFNRHKSDLKYLEYAGLGLPGVYSAVAAYESVTDGVTGLRIREDVDAWVEALTRLADDPQLRERLGSAAWDEVTDSRLLRHAARELLQILGAVLLEGPPATDPSRARLDPWTKPLGLAST